MPKSVNSEYVILANPVMNENYQEVRF